MRFFDVPEGAAEDRMRAELKEGMQFVSLPKTKKPRAMILEVKVEELSSRFRRQRPFAPWTIRQVSADSRCCQG